MKLMNLLKTFKKNMKLHKYKKSKIKNILINILAKLLIKIDTPFIIFHRKIISTYCKINNKELKTEYFYGKIRRYFKNKTKFNNKAKEWVKWNSWFGENKEMTNYAFETHYELKRKKYNLNSNKYYQEIDKRIYLRFKKKYSKYFSIN